MTPEVILASGSRYRRELIERLRIGVRCVSPPFDEEAAKQALTGAATDVIVQALALGKAHALGQRFPDALIIGSDQAADLDGELLGKPGGAAQARAQLRKLAGRTHRLVTATVVHHPATGRTEQTLDVHQMQL